ncbi:ribonuclease H-like domain-containing protein [Chaetomium tenue]|uniref:Ribonuclease H-like domain-containing protein n=1 Tax=Chaetomium tenue TaxID=1854479 RepID=A0ACB7P4P3_9PEZI|nr:ribonuclease H-like domain-containing protein [Chaetomium globosum]
MDSSQDLKPLRDRVHSTLVTVTRSVNTLANEDLQFQRTVHPSVAARLDQNTDRLLELARGVLKSASKFTAQREPQLEDVDDVEIQWKGVLDVIDSLLEKSDTCLDEYTGLVKRKDAPTTESGRDTKRPKSTTDRLDWSMKRANILKPQNTFEKKIDNFDSGPWKPLLTTKPHAQTPLDASLTISVNDEGRPQYEHPYKQEITDMRYPEHVFKSREPIGYPPLEKTTAIWVDTYEGVLEMLEELKKAPEIAIDLEHHDFRSYTGLLSLMQISTREKDWIIDTLVPWRHKLEVLNEVFADPKIVKVLHGAFMDIIWLQRDLGLYVVGLFDTFYASTALQYAGKSLAFLLKKFVDFDADKKYQLADWRLRPLPEEMFYYARSDTHFLLYIYDMLRNELAQLATQNGSDGHPTDRVIQKSKEVALQRYENSFCDPETGAGNRGWHATLTKSSTLYDGEQFAVYKAVHKWRDDIARQEDESPFFIMTQQVLSNIARIMPTDMKALWSLLESNTGALKSRLGELFKVITEAKVQGANGPTMLQFFRQSSSDRAQASLGDKPAVAAAVQDTEPLEIEELKSDRSQLWGDVALNSALDGTSKARPVDKQEMIPLYTVLFDENQPTPSAPPPKSAAKQDAEPAPVPEEGDFTLKKGRKRKASDVDTAVAPPPKSESASASTSASDAETSNDSPAAAADESEQQPDAEAQGEEPNNNKTTTLPTRRQSRRAAAKQAKAAQAGKKKKSPPAEANPETESQPEQDDDEQPFDYSAASSVLRAPRGGHANGSGDGGGGRGGRRGKASYDPYAKKSGDAPQGARKMNYEKAGRTATFKK